MPHFNRHFAGDPNAALGIWGTPSSAANFCEEDYGFSLYVAEFINSLSSLIYVYYALRPRRALLREDLKNGSRSSGRTITPPLDAMSVGMVIVGLASLAFHAGMHQLPQYCDDISMLLLMGSLLQAAHGIGRPPGDPRHKLVSGATWVALAVSSAVYLSTGTIVIHFLTFSATVLGCIPGMAIRVFYGSGPGFAKKRATEPEARLDAAEEEMRRVLKQRLIKAGVCFAVGFILWNIDLELCAELRRIRDAVGLPWGWAFELHGWWHVLTAVAGGEFIDVIRDLQLDAAATSPSPEKETTK